MPGFGESPCMQLDILHDLSHDLLLHLFSSLAKLTSGLPLRLRWYVTQDLSLRTLYR